MKNKSVKDFTKSSLLDSPARRAAIADMSARAKTITIVIPRRTSKTN
jgi:hypothetical protein